MISLARACRFAARPDITVAADTAVRLPTGRSRLLPAGSVWQATGSLPQGVVDRPAGNYVASAATEVEKTLSFSLAAGETKYVRSYVGFGVVAGRVNLELEPAEKARAELADLSYTGSPTAGK